MGSPPKKKQMHLSTKKMRKEKEMNGEIRWRESPQSKNGFAHTGPSSNSSGAASEESNKLEQEMSVEQNKGAFSNFPISKDNIKLLKAHVTFLFPIQVKTFHYVYSGNRDWRDLLLCHPPDWETSGRTSTLEERPWPSGTGSRTHEGIRQTKWAKDISDITKKLTVACFYGGTPYGGQIDSILNGIYILFGTSVVLKIISKMAS